jgi:hypothetical protein
MAQMEELIGAHLSSYESKGRFKVLELFTHDNHKAGWLEFEGAWLKGIRIPVAIRAFHCECDFEPVARSAEAKICPMYEAMLESRYSTLTASFKRRFESGARAFLPHQIEIIIQELVEMVEAGEFVEPDGRGRLQGVCLSDVTLAKIIELPVIAARGHLSRYAAKHDHKMQDGMLLEK